MKLREIGFMDGVEAAAKLVEERGDRATARAIRTLCKSESQLGDAVDAAFERFWQARPRRIGPDPKKPAKDKFRTLVISHRFDPEQIIQGMKQYASTRPDPRYTVMAQTFLSQHRFTDAIVASTPALNGSVAAPNNLGYGTLFDVVDELRR